MRKIAVFMALSLAFPGAAFAFTVSDGTYSCSITPDSVSAESDVITLVSSGGQGSCSFFLPDGTFGGGINDGTLTDTFVNQISSIPPYGTYTAVVGNPAIIGTADACDGGAPATTNYADCAALGSASGPLVDVVMPGPGPITFSAVNVIGSTTPQYMLAAAATATGTTWDALWPFLSFTIGLFLFLVLAQWGMHLMFGPRIRR